VILIVEDDITLQRAMVAMLKLDGYPLRLARSIAEARTQLADKAPTVVLIDLGLPDGSGFELLTDYSETDTALKEEDRPVMIVTTGDVSLEGAVQALRLGAFDYLTKPINIDLMRITIRRAFEYQQLRRAAREGALLAAHKEAMRATARAAAHHLSQHLTVIMGEAQLILEDQPEEPIKDGLSRIVRSAEHAAHILADLRRARHFVTKESLIAEPMLDLDAAQGDHDDIAQQS
jgi:DNA-binding NtrC family response regulator